MSGIDKEWKNGRYKAREIFILLMLIICLNAWFADIGDYMQLRMENKQKQQPQRISTTICFGGRTCEIYQYFCKYSWKYDQQQK